MEKINTEQHDASVARQIKLRAVRDWAVIVGIAALLSFSLAGLVDMVSGLYALIGRPMLAFAVGAFPVWLFWVYRFFHK